jgi:transcriptional regulator GlxA family with amidase domain
MFLLRTDHRPPMACPEPERHLLRARDLADIRYAEPVDVSAMASAPAYPSRSFRRAFAWIAGCIPLTRRLERAAALLRNTEHSITEVCLEVGLTSAGSFTAQFEKTPRL